jgi:biotin-dependent carboxylase-like uncharacterized protein
LAFEVIRPGFFTTVQDLGRWRYQMYGVPVSGAMDRRALRIANILVGNNEDKACLEVTIYGLKLKALKDSVVAITGGDLDPHIDGYRVPLWQPIKINKGELLSFDNLKSGCRAYFAVAGGIEVPEVLGSRSTYVRGGFGGFDGRPLKRGDIIYSKKPLGDLLKVLARKVPGEMIPKLENEFVVRIVMGPQEENFTERGVRTFLRSEYIISTKSDRMGYRLQGPKIEYTEYNIVSDAIVRGAIQVPGDGMPIILMSDTGTAGGYAKIATVIGPDADVLGQGKPGNKIGFQKVSIHKAHAFLKKYEDDIKKLKELLR